MKNGSNLKICDGTTLQRRGKSPCRASSLKLRQVMPITGNESCGALERSVAQAQLAGV